MRRIPLALTAIVAVVAVALPSQAAPAPPVLSKAQPTVTWRGVVDRPAPADCGSPNLGCDLTTLVVSAPKGTWITVSLDEGSSHLRVTSGGAYVGSGGQSLNANPGNSPTPTTTFRQLAAGRVTYQVAVGHLAGNPNEPVAYTGTAKLAGNAFDRAGDCGVTSGAEYLQDADEGERLRLSVQLVTAPADVAEVTKVVVPALVETYGRIKVALKVSVRAFPLKDTGTYPYEQVRKAYGGVRPAGIDVVHVLTDNFAGGFADCIGGVAYPEKAFSTGSLHYKTEGLVPVPTVKAAVIVAHEIGHLLGGQHQQGNCVEAAPQQAQQPASDGSVGPCTVMSPGAAMVSETFSTLERATIRSYVRRYAKG